MTAEKLIQIAENEPKVYEAGKAEGIEQGMADVAHLNDELEQILYGTDTGGKSFYDEFWDILQENGERRRYFYAFSNIGLNWTDEIYNPKYPIICNKTDVYDTYRMFGGNKAITDTKVPIIVNGADLVETFQNAENIVTIPLLTLNGVSTITRAFMGMFRLVNLTINGAIEANGFDFKDCTKLSKASITSIINALSTTTSGLSVTLSKNAVDTAFEGGSGGGEFHYLIDSKQNWTISLA